MSYRKVTDAFKRLAKQYDFDTDVAARYIKGNQMDQYFADLGLKVDARDFLPIITMMGVEGDTPEERTKDIHAKIEHLRAVFTDKDQTKRNQYLNMIYDRVDTFDPTTANMEDEEQVAKLFQCILMDQAIATKRIENPEYYNNRYPTKEQSAVAQARGQFFSSVAALVDKNLKSIGCRLHSLATLAITDPSVPDSVLVARVDLAKMQRDEVIAAKGAEIASSTIQIPILDDMVQLVSSAVEDTPGFIKEGSDHLEYFFSYVLGEALLQSESKNKQGYKEADMKQFRDSVYIDGMPYVDFLKKHLPNERPCDATDAKVILTSLINGRHKVDMVNAYRDNNGVMQYEAKNLSVTFTEKQLKIKQGIDARKQMDDDLQRQEEAAYLKRFTWFRRTFFNWGPFRILPKKQKPVEIPEKTRHENICKDMKKKMEPRIIEVQKRELANRLDRERLDKLVAQYTAETNRLDNSADEWDKESVMGILGKQVKGSYNIIGAQVKSAAENQKYTKVKDRLAKQVLYTQLTIERSQNGGQMGPIEQILRGDGSKATIEKNLKEQVQNIAETRALEEVFRKKVTKKGILDADQYKDYVRNGGCRHLTVDYMKLQAKYDKKKPAADKKKELTAPKKEQEVLKK